MDMIYNGLEICESDTGFVKIYGYEPTHDCYCVLLNDGYMSVKEAKSWIDTIGGE